MSRHIGKEQPHGRFRALTARHLDRIAEHGSVRGEDLFAIRVVSKVLPFRTNRYVLEELIDWDRIPDDPVLPARVSPQKGMLADEDFHRIAGLMARKAPEQEIDGAVAKIRARLNPHPAAQRELNIPDGADGALEGLQHKYRETVLVLPEQGPDLPCLLHILLSLGSVRRRQGDEDLVQMMRRACTSTLPFTGMFPTCWSRAAIRWS